jgi:hypothetical protein
LANPNEAKGRIFKNSFMKGQIFGKFQWFCWFFSKRTISRESWRAAWLADADLEFKTAKVNPNESGAKLMQNRSCSTIQQPNSIWAVTKCGSGRVWWMWMMKCGILFWLYRVKFSSHSNF